MDKLKDFFFGSQASAQKRAAPEPELRPLTDIVAVPLLGLVRAYYLLLLALLVLFVLTKSAIIGLLGGLTIVFIVAWEFYSGWKSGGLGAELRETIYAVLIALLLWFGSGFLLNTQTPINAIVSCSMLPAYERGDLVILQGAAVRTQYVDYAGPASDVNSTAMVSYQGQTEAVPGSMLARCSAPSGDAWCQAFVSAPQLFEETHGPVRLRYGPCPRYYPASGQTRMGICVVQTNVAGEPAGGVASGANRGAPADTQVPFNSSHDLIVYSPAPGDLYAQVGDIVHRAAFAMNTSTGVIYFPKGDNNPIYDFQAHDEASEAGNQPVKASQIKGKVLARIPYLGNLKLFITPQVLVGGATAGCDSYYIH